jgi:L-aspartate oxidase
MRLGAAFDRYPDGSLMLTREGGHRADRIVHAGGDATGAEVQRALHEAVHRDPWIRLVEHALVLDLLRSADGRAAGLTLHVLDEGAEEGVGAILARAVVLATGGMGQVYSSTTNPAVSTGDGVALALRAGATVTDVEFVQFHPTSFVTAGITSVQRPLISEALRGEGAHLVDESGARFMVGQHELAELAPRDVVAKGIHRLLLQTGADHVYLDARHLGKDFLEERFPTIVASTRAAGVDPATELIPVAPAAHYASGGVRTDLSGRSSIPGLYACGEVACTGVHGANRLASNSLLEGLVFARRIADDIARDLPRQRDPVPPPGGPAWVVDPAIRGELQRAMTRGAGVLRSADSLATAGKELSRLSEQRTGPRTAAWEATNLLTVAGALVASAGTRRETRGCHWREDYPTVADEWRGHVLDAIDPKGRLTQTFAEMA